VTTAEKKSVLQQRVELAPGQSVETSFPADQPGVYHVAVQDQANQVLATGVVEIRDIEREFVQTARNMESLSQWAEVSGGACWPAEQLLDAEQVLNTLQSAGAQPGRAQPLRYPAGVNGWVLGLLLGCLCGEWILRKRWGLS
jgi:hypothetical protein